jgi:hypothetical protein
MNDIFTLVRFILRSVRRVDTFSFANSIECSSKLCSVPSESVGSVLVMMLGSTTFLSFFGAEVLRVMIGDGGVFSIAEPTISLSSFDDGCGNLSFERSCTLAGIVGIIVWGDDDDDDDDDGGDGDDDDDTVGKSLECLLDFLLSLKTASS